MASEMPEQMAAGNRKIFMINKLPLTVTVFFIWLTPIFVAEAESDKSDLQMELSEFKMQQSGSENASSWELQGKTARSKGTKINIHELSLEIYPENSPDITIKSPFCRYFKNDRVIQSDEKVYVRSKNFILKGKDYYFDINKQKMHIDDNAVMIIKKTDFINSSNPSQ